MGMGHLLLEVNPEDTFENQPVRAKRGLVVSAARLDNRAALLEAFDVSASEAPQLSDGHLVSLAYDHWGEDVSSHLQGDWALAAWDERERSLLLARDAFGNATLYYHQGKGFTAFASSLKALLAIPGVKKEPDRLRLAQILVVWDPDAELTAYKDFRRLLWAHAMTVGPNGQTRIWRHWSPEGREPLSYRRDEEYAEAFLEFYTRAVQSCLRTRKPIAALLSGGRDSGSVVALAAPLLARERRRLSAYTSVPYLPPDGAGAQRFGNEWERAHATAVMAGPNVEHSPVDAANYGIIQGIRHFLEVHDGPSHAATNHFWMHALAETASRNGNAVLLTGQSGNCTVSWAGNGSALFAFLQGKPAMALRLFTYGEANPWLTLKRQVLKPLLTPSRRAFRRLQLWRGRPWQAYSVLNPQMASELDLDGRMREAAHDPTFTPSPVSDTRLLFFQPSNGTTIGIWTELAARHSLSCIDPTSNLSMLEFLLRVPDDRFCRKGQRSLLLGHAFQKRLPEQVLEGRQKGLQAADAGHRILRELSAFLACLHSLDSLPEAREMLDIPVMRRCLDDLLVKVDPVTTSMADHFVRGLGVGLFLCRLADPHPE